MSNLVLNQLKTHWRRPPIEIEVGGRTIQLGKGKAATKITVHKPSIVRRFLSNPSMAFGEAYMNGDLEIEGDLLDILEGFHLAGESLQLTLPVKTLRRLRSLAPSRIGRQAALKNAQHHYDIGNDFYKLWLDPTLTYTCAYFLDKKDTLEQAQKQKLELVCRKARFARGQRILDIGCGWGSLLFHAAENYGVHATGVVAAKEQGRYIKEEAKRRGLESKIDVLVDDWRSASLSLNASQPFDRVVSVGVLEHVGERQYAQFFAKYRELLAPDGVAFVHTIGRTSPGISDPWMVKYIFPGGYLPSLDQMAQAVAQNKMMMVDVESLWQHYDLTLQHWLKDFEEHVPEITKMFDEKFVRMWRLYLAGSIGMFRWGGVHLWQAVILPSKSSPWPLNREVNIKQLEGQSKNAYYLLYSR